MDRDSWQFCFLLEFYHIFTTSSKDIIKIELCSLSENSPPLPEVSLSCWFKDHSTSSEPCRLTFSPICTTKVPISLLRRRWRTHYQRSLNHQYPRTHYDQFRYFHLQLQNIQISPQSNISDSCHWNECFHLGPFIFKKFCTLHHSVRFCLWLLYWIWLSRSSQKYLWAFTQQKR